jgi:hypothetical protein
MTRDPLAIPNDPVWDTTPEVDALRGTLIWNTSFHEPWWRAWLTSWQLFATYRDMAPQVGRVIHRVAGGCVFEYHPADFAIWVQVWLAPGEMLVAYPSMAEVYGAQGPEFGGLFEFDEWVAHLRNSSPLELGYVRERCSYGAMWSGDISTPPVVKWAQAGDWAALARNWYIAGMDSALTGI